MKYNPDQAVIILAADENYMDHARSVFAGCIIQGGWQGQFALIVPPGTDASDFEARGIAIQEASSTDPFFQKYHIFAPYFRRWKVALYMDCDVLVQAPLMPLIDEAQKDTILADREEFTLEHTFTYWRRERDADLKREGKPVPENQDALIERLWLTYGKSFRIYNTALLLFRPEDLPVDALSQLAIMHDATEPINSHVQRGTDQPIINLVFYDELSQIRENIFSYWAREDEGTKIVHYCHGYAPWINKPHGGMDAYANRALGVNCYAAYQNNLAEFYNLFPRK